MPDEQPKMYTDLAGWWPLLSQPADYAEEAGIFQRVLLAANPRIHTLLELGSGGGNNASHLKQRFAMTLVDRSPGMLAVSQQLNPTLPHQQGDMRSARLGQTFDAVFIHDAICYMLTEDDLRQAIQTAAAHLKPGGVALLVPDHMAETFRPHTDHGGHDGAGRSLRYLEWSYDPDPSDTLTIADYTYLLREGDAQVTCLYDRHVNGLFPRATWLGLMAESGFEARLLPFEHSEVAPDETEMVLGVLRKHG